MCYNNFVCNMLFLLLWFCLAENITVFQFKENKWIVAQDTILNLEGNEFDCDGTHVVVNKKLEITRKESSKCLIKLYEVFKQKVQVDNKLLFFEQKLYRRYNNKIEFMDSRHFFHNDDILASIFESKDELWVYFPMNKKNIFSLATSYMMHKLKKTRLLNIDEAVLFKTAGFVLEITKSVYKSFSIITLHLDLESFIINFAGVIHNTPFSIKPINNQFLIFCNLEKIAKVDSLDSITRVKVYKKSAVIIKLQQIKEKTKTNLNDVRIPIHDPFEKTYSSAEKREYKTFICILSKEKEPFFKKDFLTFVLYAYLPVDMDPDFIQGT